MHIAKGAFEVFNAHQASPSKSVQRVHQILNLEVNHIMKGGYEHFMQKEIHEQPETLARTMQGRIAFDTAAKVKQLCILPTAFCLLLLHLASCHSPFACCLLPFPFAFCLCIVSCPLQMLGAMCDRL